MGWLLPRILKKIYSIKYVVMKKGFHDILSMNDKVYVCMASKLPRVVLIRIKSGLVYNLIMMAFNKGLKVRYSSKYL